MSVVHRPTSRRPRSAKPAASSRACQPSFVPIVAVFVEQTVFFLLLGQPSELGVQGMIGRKERLLAMQDRWMAVAIWSRQWMWRVLSEIEIRMAGVRCPTGHAGSPY